MPTKRLATELMAKTSAYCRSTVKEGTRPAIQMSCICRDVKRNFYVLVTKLHDVQVAKLLLVPWANVSHGNRTSRDTTYLALSIYPS